MDLMVTEKSTLTHHLQKGCSSLWQCRKDYSLSSSQVAGMCISDEEFVKCLEGNGGKARKIESFQTQTLIRYQACLENLNGRNIIEVGV